MENQTGQEAQVEVKTTTVMPDQTKPADVSPETSQPDPLPEDASERTRKEFEKLKEHNKQLSEKLKKFEEPQMPSVLDSLNPEPVYQPEVQQYQNLSQQQVDTIANQFVDSEGFVNIQAVEAALAKANREAAEANSKYNNLEKRVTRYEHDAQTTKAHELHPYLDPARTEQFDPKFYNLVKNELIGQMMTGKQDLMEAANRVKRDLYDPTASREAKTQQEEARKQQTVDERTQATANPSYAKDFSSDHDADLIRRTRAGDKAAIYERLKRSNY